MLDRPTTDAEGAQTKRSDRETGELLHTCPDCGVVYLNEQPHECSNCDRMTVSVDGDDQDHSED